MGLRTRRRRTGARGRAKPALLVACGAGAAALAASLDKRRRHMIRDRTAALLRRGAEQARRRGQYAAGVAKGAAYRVSPGKGEGEREYDDVTLARKVESEIFRPADAPKDSVSVNVQHGVVELRGEVKQPEQVKALGEAAGRVAGVKDVHNLLHTPGSPPKHSPPSDPEEVRERAAEPSPATGAAGDPPSAATG